MLSLFFRMALSECNRFFPFVFYFTVFYCQKTFLWQFKDYAHSTKDLVESKKLLLSQHYNFAIIRTKKFSGDLTQFFG